MSLDLAAALAPLELFRGLTEDECRSIAELGRLEYWKAGALLLEEGAFGPRMVVLLEGEVEILRRDANGVERAVGRVAAGQALGEMSLLLDLPRPATVRAVADLAAFAIDREAFLERIRRSEPAALKLGFELSRTLSRRLLGLNERVTALLSEDEHVRGRYGEARQELFQLWDLDPSA